MSFPRAHPRVGKEGLGKECHIQAPVGSRREGRGSNKCSLSIWNQPTIPLPLIPFYSLPSPLSLISFFPFNEIKREKEGQR